MPTEYTAQHRTIAAQVGGEFVIVLEANPTTGYQWEAIFGVSLLQLLDDQYSGSGPGVGSGGTQRFRFRAVAPGDGDIRMTYKRSWEATPAQEVVFQLRIGT